MDIFKSETVTINSNINNIYSKLSNPESFNVFADRLPEEAKSKLDKVKFEKDSITVVANPVGEVRLNIVERVEPNRIVFAAAQSPVPLQAIVNLELVNEHETRVNAELGVELNPFIRPMLSKPLQDVASKFGEMLSKLPFDLI